jgi:uncharacterized protein YcbX
MPHVVALYRYPVKGFTPESCRAVTVLEEGRIAGDRALAFRFADSGLPEHAWSKKYGFAVLANTPALARLDVRFDQAARRLRIALGDDVLAEAALDDEGRRHLADAVERYVLTSPENPLVDHPERRPLQLIGDGVTPRYQDSQRGEITLHSRESVAAVAAALRKPEVDEVRFRSNIVVEGLSAWEEQDWIGRKLRIGAVELEATSPKTRCLATHANPRTGERDLPMMQLLVRAFDQQQPTFAVALVASGRGGEIRVGDAVTVLEA